jgi:hypothetical protein
MQNSRWLMRFHPREKHAVKKPHEVLHEYRRIVSCPEVGVSNDWQFHFLPLTFFLVLLLVFGASSGSVFFSKF